MRTVSLSLICFLSLLAVGCGSGLNTAPVSGVITLDGAPLPDAIVTFTPTETTGIEAPASTGRTDASGRYTLSVTVTGDPGAVLGSHDVTVVLEGDEGPEDSLDADVIDPEAEELVPPHDFTFNVESAGTDAANFDLQS